MSKWYKLDALRNVSGPYDLERLKQLGRDGLNFRVGSPEVPDWLPLDAIAHWLSGSAPLPVVATAAAHPAYLLERGMNELIGLCKGIVSDGRVDAREAAFLRSWFDNNREVASVWPANVLSERMEKIFADGVADPQERADLAILLARFSGVIPGVADAEQLSSQLPLDDPPPDVEFDGKSFHLTGNFILGAPEHCEARLRALGGTLHRKPSLETDYLVIGALGNAAWEYGPYGKEIEAVVRNRAQGAKTAIVSEEHWSFYLTPRNADGTSVQPKANGAVG